MSSAWLPASVNTNGDNYGLEEQDDEKPLRESGEAGLWLSARADAHGDWAFAAAEPDS